VEDLQKLLNIKMLIANGLKISKIASYPPAEIPKLAFEIVSDLNDNHQAIEVLKMAMLQFDQGLFEKTYIQLTGNLSFPRVFLEVFIPLLEHLGYLWQVDSITPAHEHFISSLIQQKIIANIERVQPIMQEQSERVYVLYLPHNEIHDLGLLYLHYEITLRGKKSIYLGSSVHIENLFDVMALYPSITFASYLTVEPSTQHMQSYMARLNDELMVRNDDEMWLIGRRTADIAENQIPKGAKVFAGINPVLEVLNA